MKANKFLRKILMAIIMVRGLSANAQSPVKRYVEQNAVAIKAVDPDSTNYTDLEPIGNAIGDAKVVMLGEQDHGDAPAFLAKTRLIKYLHQKKGFNVLAFESDFFGLNDGWDKLPKQRAAIDSFLWRNVFPIWTACESCVALFYHYIPSTWNTSSPLNITGFDCQQYLNYSYLKLGKRLDTILRGYNLPITKQAGYATAIIPLVDSSKVWVLKPPKDKSEISACLQYLHTIKTQLATIVKPGNFWLQVVDNMVQQVESARFVAETKKPGQNSRDIRMAKNLQWLTMEKFKGQKIIVWAADAHIARIAGNMKENFFDKDTTMGDTFAQLNRNSAKVYSVGFTSFDGEAGRLGARPYRVYAPRKDGLETYFNKNDGYAFVDFQQFNLQNPSASEYFYGKPLGHLNYDARWNHVFDGIFFIRKIYPCEPFYLLKAANL